ncbi:hypothetical protein ACET3Z_001062 [Daucus carota]
MKSRDGGHIARFIRNPGLPYPYPQKVKYAAVLYWACPKTKTALVEDKEAGKEEELVVKPIEAGMDLVRQLDARLPASFVPDFRQLAPKFVDQYSRFMRTVKGLGFTSPVFEHIDRGDLSGTGWQVSLRRTSFP